MTKNEDTVVMVLFGTIEDPVDRARWKSKFLKRVIRLTTFEPQWGAGMVTTTVPVDHREVPVRLCAPSSAKRDLPISMLYSRPGHVFLLFFSLFQIRSLEFLEEMWLPEIRKLKPQRPLVLVGLGEELKDTWDKEDHEKMEALGIKPIPAELIQAFQERNGIHIYKECSVKTSSGIQDLLIEAATAGLKYKRENEANPPHEEEEKKKGCSVA